MNYYIELPEGKLYFALKTDINDKKSLLILKHESMCEENYEYIDNETAENIRKKLLYKHHRYYLNVRIESTLNGPFMFVELTDNFYGEPCFKIYNA
jgi:hypothetical protein